MKLTYKIWDKTEKEYVDSIRCGDGETLYLAVTPEGDLIQYGNFTSHVLGEVSNPENFEIQIKETIYEFKRVSMQGFNDTLEKILPLAEELKEEVFNLGFGVSDMSYMGWTEEKPETQNMINLFKDLQNTCDHLHKIVKQGLGR